MIGSRDGELRAPDLIQPVIGYRVWRIRDGDLVSQYTDVRWAGGPLRAECLSELYRRGPGLHPTPAPDPKCSCGIYAYFRPSERLGASSDSPLVLGAVVLWGRIEVHRSGMRAEWARPVAIGLPPFSPRERRQMLRRISERLGLEAVLIKDLRRVALRHGQPLPGSMQAA